MSDKFANAPLVELVAEVRWEPAPRTHAESDRAFDESDPDSQNEEMYSQLGQGLAAIGFLRSERIFPQGLIVPPDRAVFRYARLGDDQSILYHVGPGVFSVNAIPPYQTWEEFRPAISSGLDVLIGLLGETGSQRFSRVTLRYIDAFDDDFLEGGTRYEFLTRTLGFNVTVPQVISNVLAGPDPEVFIQYSAELAAGGRLAIRVGDATVSNADAVVLDTSIAYRDGSDLSSGAVLHLLDSAHGFIHDSFVSMTSEVEHVLRRGAV